MEPYLQKMFLLHETQICLTYWGITPQQMILLSLCDVLTTHPAEYKFSFDPFFAFAL